MHSIPDLLLWMPIVVNISLFTVSRETKLWLVSFWSMFGNVLTFDMLSNFQSVDAFSVFGFCFDF